jgi:hypothetical protein
MPSFMVSTSQPSARSARASLRSVVARLLLSAAALACAGVALACSSSDESGGDEAASATSAAATTSTTTGGTVCTAGDTEPCYTGPEGTSGVGPCVAGTRSCAADGSGFGECEGEVTPVAETCATPDDDDCDGSVNEEGEGCVCAPGAFFDCYDGPDGTEGVGICEKGVAVCDDLGTSLGDCTAQVLPALEDCATPEDEDCDGLTPPCP